MSIPSSFAATHGKWVGSSKLYLPDDPLRASPSQAEVAPVARGKFLTISYDWSFEGEPQSGVILLGLEGETASAIFIDSWHMGDKLMELRGTSTQTGVSVLGHYSVEGSPEWGWRIAVDFEPGLRVMMYNVIPEEGEVLGFELTDMAR